jgi:hypothetical protein
MNGTFTLTPGTNVSSYSSRITDNILRVGVNYKFGGPVVANTSAAAIRTRKSPAFRRAFLLALVGPKSFSARKAASLICP